MKNINELKKLVKRMAKKEGQEKALEVVVNLHKSDMIPRDIWGELKPWMMKEFFGM